MRDAAVRTVVRVKKDAKPTCYHGAKTTATCNGSAAAHPVEPGSGSVCSLQRGPCEVSADGRALEENCRFVGLQGMGSNVRLQLQVMTGPFPPLLSVASTLHLILSHGLGVCYGASWCECFGKALC